MIEAVLNGRTGNCLFQYAAARALAERTGTTVLLNLARFTSWCNPRGGSVARTLRLFSLNASYTGLDADAGRTLSRLGLRERREDFIERSWGYDCRFEALGAATRLTGYFQSAQYWTGFESRIRADLRPREIPADPLFREAAATIGRTMSVSMHVRRGDYRHSPLHNVCTREYYVRAMASMRARLDQPTFFIFSDDMNWCSSQFAAPDVIPIDIPLCRSAPALDMHLMSHCRHHIVSNSTYSWWGAWLNDKPGKIVVAPDRWFNDAAMNRLAMVDTVPSEWDRIPAGATSVRAAASASSA